MSNSRPRKAPTATAPRVRPSAVHIKMAIDKIVTEPSLVAVLQISDQARDQAQALVGLVDQAADGSSSAETQAEIAKQQKLLFTSISHLRGLHRSACFSARETKTDTAEARQEVDRLHLQLQNLYYEQRHLQGEITACESYEYVNLLCFAGLVIIGLLMLTCAQPQIPATPSHSCR